MNKLSFDWTVNLGHVLTFAGCLCGGFLAFESVDKRVVVLEEARVYQLKRDETQDGVQRELRGEIKEALRDVRGSLERLGDRIDNVKRR